MQQSFVPVKVKIVFLACMMLGVGHAGEGGSLQVKFFFTPACRMCKPTKDAVKKAQAAYGERISVEWIDMSASGTKAARRLFDLLDQYGYKKTVTPKLVVFAGNTCLAGPERIISDLNRTIEQELAGSTKTLAAVHVNRMSFWAISAAGLADGINPCAFATIVLLVSMLAAVGKSKRETLLLGGTFTLAVFLTYLLIGLFLFGVLSRLTGWLLVSDLIFDGAFLLCVICATLNLYDAIITRMGKEPKAMLLKLPDSLKNRVRKSMRAGVHSRGLVMGAFTAGVIVSLLESACTGQVYFPVLAALACESATQTRGLMLLLWYNLLFVLPLIGVFGATLAGVSSERLAKFSRSNLSLAKLLLGLVFIGMAAWMWPGVAWPPGVR